jgi:hypothetical protein
MLRKSLYFCVRFYDGQPVAQRNHHRGTSGTQRTRDKSSSSLIFGHIPNVSRLSATRLVQNHEIDFLELGKFDEDSLYANVDRLAQRKY